MRKSIVLSLLLASCGAANASPPGVTRVTESAAHTSPTTESTAAIAPTSIANTTAAAPADSKRPAMLLTAATGDVIMTGGGQREVRVRGIVSPSQRLVVSGSRLADGTLVEWRNAATSEIIGSATIAGDFHPVAIDPTDKIVALVDGDPADHARASTTVVLVDAAHGELKRWTFSGAIVPEAFANFFSDASGLPGGVFVIEYLGATTYRVRVIDPADGTLGLPLNLRNKAETIDQQMTAVSRTAVFDPMTQMLFTLYQGQATENGQPEGAFIHTLGLINGVWCLEVPEALGLADHAGALAVSPDGQHLFAASSTGGVASYTVADITDSPDMPTARTVTSVGSTSASSHVAVAASYGAVVVALDRQIFYLDPITLAVRDELTSEVPVEALTARPDGSVVVVGSGRAVTVAPSHQLLDEMRLPADLGEVTRVAVVG
jgi:hypothetical protein